MKSEDLNGLADPLVYVDVMGHRQHTRVVKKTTSAVFDDTFFFNLKDVSVEEFEDGAIKVSVMLFPCSLSIANPDLKPC